MELEPTKMTKATSTFTYSDALQAQQITNQYSVAFFDSFLRQDTAAKAFLENNHYPQQLEHRVK